MAAFARARTRSLLSMLWPVRIQTINSETDCLDKPKDLFTKHAEEKKRFLEVSKNGGMWFS